MYSGTKVVGHRSAVDCDLTRGNTMSLTILSPILCGLFFVAQHVAWKRERPALWFGSLTVAAFFGWVAVGYVAGVGCGA
jgi:hypothetical protein